VGSDDSDSMWRTLLRICVTHESNEGKGSSGLPAVVFSVPFMVENRVCVAVAICLERIKSEDKETLKMLVIRGVG